MKFRHMLAIACLTVALNLGGVVLLDRLLGPPMPPPCGLIADTR